MITATAVPVTYQANGWAVLQSIQSQITFQSQITYYSFSISFGSHVAPCLRMLKNCNDLYLLFLRTLANTMLQSLVFIGYCPGF